MYNIGQILYIISNRSRTIEPVQVHSKQTLESFEGTKVQHMCKTIRNDTICLEKQSENAQLSGIFSTIEEAESHLLKLASEMVRTLAATAAEKAASFVIEPPVRADATIEPSKVPAENQQDVHNVTLPDGTTARLHLPPDMT